LTGGKRITLTEEGSIWDADYPGLGVKIARRNTDDEVIVIVRGIERRRIFRSDADRALFLDRLADWAVESRAGLYAWALMPNHAHLLVRTGQLPLSRRMQAWLSVYGTAFNRRLRRSGYLYQHRFKSTLVEEDPHVHRLLAYIHLNPVRWRLAVTLDALDRYPWTGHAVLLGNHTYPA